MLGVLGLGVASADSTTSTTEGPKWSRSGSVAREADRVASGTGSFLDELFGHQLLVVAGCVTGRRWRL